MPLVKPLQSDNNLEVKALGGGYLRLFLAVLFFRSFLVVLFKQNDFFVFSYTIFGSVVVYYRELSNCFFFYSDSFVEFFGSFLF